MTIARDILNEVEAALHRSGITLSGPELHEVANQISARYSAYRRSGATRIEISHTGLGNEIQHRTLRAILARIHGVQDSGVAAFNARLKHLLDLGLIPDRRPNGRGRRTYRLVDIYNMALCLQLQRCFVPPATAVRFVIDNAPFLDDLWKEIATPSNQYLEIAVDAFAVLGAPDREGGKGARGNESNALAIGRLGHHREGVIQPSSISIDIMELQVQVIFEMMSTTDERDDGDADGQLSGA